MKKTWNRTSAIKIRTLLYQKGMTQTEMANKSGLTRQTVSFVCNGKSCSADTAQKIAECLGVQMEEIMEEAT